MNGTVRRRDLEWLGTLAAVGLSAIVLSFNLGANLNVFDGAISTSAATFTLHGLLPYRDYWLLYGPLSGFLAAIPTALVGPSIELSRGIGFVVLCFEALAAFRVARIWAGPGPAIALSVCATVMAPAIIGLDLSAWLLAMTLALAAFYVAIGTSRSGVLVGFLVGLAFLSRLDLGGYALIGALMVRDRRAVLLGFAVVAVPFAAFLLATTDPSALFEQLIWFPVIGQHEFRSMPSPEEVVGQPTAALMSVPLLVLPRLAIALGVIRLVLRSRQHRDRMLMGLLGLVVFAALCQLQTFGRADLEHLSMAATPALLLFAVWFPDGRPGIARFGALAAITAACVVVGLTGHRLYRDTAAYDRQIVATSAWLRAATDPADRIFVGLTSNRYTFLDPLVIYYLADRAPAVRDTLFNPGVTNTDPVQARMVADLARTAPRYIVLDREAAGRFESFNDSAIPGSERLDRYLGQAYHSVCDLGGLVIETANVEQRPSPPCPEIGP
jgi:hypothetical protein